LFLVLTLPVCQTEAQVPPINPGLKWFTDARFGLFIHWDMSSVAGTEISWSRKATKPLDITGDPAGYVKDTAYDHLYRKFNPQKFNAEDWVRIAKNAGMKYIIFTAKHHGGFCMWNTKYTDYSIMHTAFKRDVVKELSVACHKAGLKFGLYYSQRDWHHPDYGMGDNSKYIEYMNNQIRELLTGYGKVDVIWWDSYGRGDLQTFWRVAETYRLVKKSQPGIVMNDRLKILGDSNILPPPYWGDWNTPEQTLGAFQNSRPWESCMTLVVTPEGGGWSYRVDGRLRSYKECIQSLVSCATGDGNLLLDAGPNPLGEIPADQTKRLLQMGAWIKKYGESIYGTRGGPYRNGEWGGSTFKGNKIYLHIAKWNGNHIFLPALHAKVIKYANMGKPLNHPLVNQNAGNLIITLAPDKQEDIDTVIVLELDGDATKEFVNTNPMDVTFKSK
jgi:alpha-L-fucosidase